MLLIYLLLLGPLNFANAYFRELNNMCKYLTFAYLSTVSRVVCKCDTLVC